MSLGCAHSCSLTSISSTQHLNDDWVDVAGALTLRILGECSAFLASGSDPTDDRRRHKV